MNLPMFQGFGKSLMMTVLSEVGDRTFCVAAILAMRHPWSSVLCGCLSSVILTTTLSAVIGWAAPNLIPRELAHRITTLLFFGFGLWSLWEAYNEDDDDNEELEQVEKELNQDAAPKDTTGKGPKGKEGSKVAEDLKKQRKPFLTNFFSPVFIEAFSVTFFGEWGDKSQLATIGLAADENAVGVILGGILAQVLCTVAAVAGGKSLASKISERLVTMASGVVFLIFGVQSFLSTVY
ncbi:GDT1-like protein 5 isoform X1 [Coffea arabica]|uniref:GDT1 family protein n=1 Tax=Coffea arabica TaxID=13443 RepID=A0A6P6TCI1_COFAR